MSEWHSEIARLTAKLKRKLWAVVYISKADAQVIVTPRGQGHSAGYEQDMARAFPYATDSESLGTAILDALMSFTTRDVDLTVLKRTDWPSFKASGASSVRRFEERYTRLEVEAGPNLIIHVEGYPIGSEAVTVCSALSVGRGPEVLGDRVFQVAVCCNHLRDAGLA